MENFKWRNRRLEVEQMLIEALEDTRVEVARVTASKVVIEINEHGPKVYYFDVGSDQILRLELGSIHWPFTDPGDGRALYVDSGNDTWPNDHFEIVRTVRGRLWVGVFCLGGKLEPVRQINTLEEDPLVLKCESPVAMFKGPLDALKGNESKKPAEVWV
jgi:hypothetical protein